MLYDNRFRQPWGLYVANLFLGCSAVIRVWCPRLQDVITWGILSAKFCIKQMPSYQVFYRCDHLNVANMPYMISSYDPLLLLPPAKATYSQLVFIVIHISGHRGHRNSRPCATSCAEHTIHALPSEILQSVTKSGDGISEVITLGDTE
jgi:hypothetical protein